MEVLKVENLIKKYKSVDAVRGCSFEVQRGEILVIIGASGSRKIYCIKMY